MYRDVFRGKMEQGYVVDGDGVYHVYEAPTVGDIPSVPTGTDMAFSDARPRPGSKLIIAENAALYTLTESRVWQLMIKGEEDA